MMFDWDYLFSLFYLPEFWQASWTVVQLSAASWVLSIIIAGSDMTFPPFEYMEHNKPTGFDIEFLDGIAKGLGIDALLKKYNFQAPTEDDIEKLMPQS